MPSYKYKLHKLKSIFTHGGGCGCNPNESDVIEPKPKPKPPNQDNSVDPTTTDTSLSPPVACCCPTHKTVIAATCPKIHDSLAVVQDSDDPYRDFRRSMLQMIFENEIYSRNDLQQLLDCFLQLNSPLHHRVIFRAFVEIWNDGDGEDDVNVKTFNSQVG